MTTKTAAETIVQSWEEDARRYAQNASYWRARHDEMCSALRALLERLDNMTSMEFAHGGERAEREVARALLAKIEGKATA